MSTGEENYIETVENLLTYETGLSHGGLKDYIQFSAIYSGSVRKFAADLYRYTRNAPLTREPFTMLYCLDGFLVKRSWSDAEEVSVNMNDLAETGLDELLIKCCAFMLRNLGR